MTREQEIKERLDKATPPPFVITETGVVRCPLCDGDGEVDSILLDQPSYPVSVQVYGIGTNFKDHEAFLHHAPEDIRCLLARNEELQRGVELLKKVAERARDLLYDGIYGGEYYDSLLDTIARDRSTGKNARAVALYDAIVAALPVPEESVVRAQMEGEE